MAKTVPQLDVLVLGEHPSAYLAAELLAAAKPVVHAAHCTIPHEDLPDRLVLVNPKFFSLHKPLEKLKKKMPLTGVWGMNFLGDDVVTRGEYASKSPAALVSLYSDIRKAVAKSAKDAGVRLIHPKVLNIHRIEQQRFVVETDGHMLHPKAILLAGRLTAEQARALALPEQFSAEVMRRYAFVRLRMPKGAAPAPKPVVHMSLDLGGKQTWAWMLGSDDEVQLAVEQSFLGAPSACTASIRVWADVLRKHNVLKSPDPIVDEQVQIMEIPAAGALSREIVGNRTLLFGPAGGFYTACMEDIYPNCWSAIFAVEAIRAALTQPHLQDALQTYREKWSTTLGDYLRGPQQNLRFLLPLVYRNPVMTSRMAESILQGKSVVR